MNCLHPLKAAALALPLALLAGCSNKPSQADVAQALAAVYDCPVLEVRDVQKLDGAPGPAGTYDVAMAYTVAIKGGDAVGVRLITDWVSLRAEKAAAVAAVTALQRRPSQDDARIQALEGYTEQLDAALSKLIPCGGAEIQAVVMPLYEQAKEVFKAGNGNAAVPIGARLTRPGNLAKSERGWFFNRLALGFSGFELVTAKPSVLTLPPSKVSGLLSASASAPAASGGERTLVGTIHRGATDSCLAIAVAGTEKCYGLPGEPEQAQRIYGVCGDGDRCAITGQWDDKAESLGAFSRVEKVAP